MGNTGGEGGEERGVKMNWEAGRGREGYEEAK